MPAPRIVWMVELERGSTAEVKGTLFLEDDAVRFVATDSGVETRVALDAIRKTRRNRGSPILLLDEAAPGSRKFAFYFSQPPPLEPPEPGSEPVHGAGFPAGARSGAFGAIRRSPKRRHMRTNLSYLATTNAGMKEEVAEWVSEIRERIEGAR
jgi:hypothetical protein